MTPGGSSVPRRRRSRPGKATKPWTSGGGRVRCRQTSARLLLALGATYLIWGSTYLAIRIMVTTIPPLLGNGLRFLSAGAVLYGFLLFRGGTARARVSLAEVGSAALVGALVLGAGFTLLTFAERQVPSGLAALLIASTPLWVVVLRLAVGRESIPVPTIGIVILGFAGVGLLTMPPSGASSGVPVAVAAAVLLAAAFEAAGAFWSARVRLPSDSLLATALQMLCGGSIALLGGLFMGELEQLNRAAVSAESVVALAYLILPGSVLAYSAFVWLLKNTSVSTATSYAYVNPVIAVALGWALLGEELTARLGLGMAAIVVSVTVVVTSEAKWWSEAAGTSASTEPAHGGATSRRRAGRGLSAAR